MKRLRIYLTNGSEVAVDVESFKRLSVGFEGLPSISWVDAPGGYSLLQFLDFRHVVAIVEEK